MKIIDKFEDKINGALSTFDRMILKGHLRQFFSPSGKMHFLSQENVLLKDFGEYAKGVTNQIKAHVENIAQELQRPLIYLYSPKVSKEGTALDRTGVEKRRKWVPMGKSIANLYRYAQISETANRRYLDAVSLTEPRTESVLEIEKICNRVSSGKRVFSGMNPVSKEAEQIFLAVMDGGNHINGFTNASVRSRLFPCAAADDKKIRNKTTRIIAKLRAHKLIAKIPHSFRYKVTPKGVRIMSAVLAVKNNMLTDVMKMAS